MKRRTPKPYSEKSRDEKIAEAHASIANLRHPHNRYSPNIYAAINRWNAELVRLGEKRI